MHPTALGYIGVRTRSLEDWAGYGTKLLGMQVADRSATTMALRMDDRRQRLVVSEDGGEGIGFFGWDVDSAGALDSAAARIEAAGISVARGSAALCDERRVAGLVVLDDPNGNRIELFHGAERATAAFEPGRNISGFRTGPLGLGHVVLNVARMEPMLAFYRDVLGLKVSDFYSHPFKACFFHANPRHHSFALIETGKDAVHHLMVELYSFDDVGQGLDLAQQEQGRMAVTLGRHCGDFMTSFYTWTPSAFMVEYGWGGRLIDTATWVANERREGPSLWGHDRLWLSDADRAKARRLCLDIAEQGVRRPVQVIEGNHEVMPGVCPWWDRAVARR